MFGRHPRAFFDRLMDRSGRSGSPASLSRSPAGGYQIINLERSGPIAGSPSGRAMAAVPAGAAPLGSQLDGAARHQTPPRALWLGPERSLTAQRPKLGHARGQGLPRACEPLSLFRDGGLNRGGDRCNGDRFCGPRWRPSHRQSTISAISITSASTRCRATTWAGSSVTR